MMFSAWKNNKQLLSAISPEKQLFVIVFLAVCGIVYTDSTKINRPGYNICMYWTNFRQPTAHVQQNIFGKTTIAVCSLHLYASFGTF